jgi:hemolysin activation/secretion protein
MVRVKSSVMDSSGSGAWRRPRKGQAPLLAALLMAWSLLGSGGVALAADDPATAANEPAPAREPPQTEVEVDGHGLVIVVTFQTPTLDGRPDADEDEEEEEEDEEADEPDEASATEGARRNDSDGGEVTQTPRLPRFDERLSSERTDVDTVRTRRGARSELVVKQRGSMPWRMAARFDQPTSGSGATGTSLLAPSHALAPRGAARFNVIVDSPLSLDDRLTLSHDRQMQDRMAQRQQLSWSLPWGSWSFSLGSDRRRAFSVTPTRWHAAREQQASEGTEVAAAWKLSSDADARTTLEGRRARRSSRGTVDGLEPRDSQQRAGYTDLTLIHERRLGAMIVDAKLGWRGGSSVDADALAPLGVGAVTEQRFNVREASTSVHVPLAARRGQFVYRGQLRVQSSPTSVPLAQTIFTGGPGLAQGLSLGPRYAGDGVFLRHELARRKLRRDLPLELYGAVDSGLVRDEASGSGRRTVGSAGLGARARASSMQADIAVYAPWRTPHPDTPRSPTVAASLGLDF